MKKDIIILMILLTIFLAGCNRPYSKDNIDYCGQASECRMEIGCCDIHPVNIKHWTDGKNAGCSTACSPEFLDTFIERRDAQLDCIKNRCTEI